PRAQRAAALPPPVASAAEPIEAAPKPVVPPLFDAHPKLGAAIPWIALGSFPSRVDRLAIGDRSILVKRDDRASEPYGGGKPRKLEHFLADAIARGKTEVLTSGGAGSNHVVATAAYARKLGLATRALLLPQPLTDAVRENQRLARSFGAVLVDVPGRVAI